MIELVKYTPDMSAIWNEFVESSKNGTFLFNRGYMDYHSDRFKDHSFLIYRKGKLYALLPANENNGVLYSHQGLTYGGVVMNEKCTAEGILEVFGELVKILRENGFRKMIYKPVPHIYHKLPAQEDLYSLFREGAGLAVRNISSTIDLRDPLPMFHDRKTALNKAKRNNIVVKESEEYEDFWEVLKENLWNTYNVKPVHCVEEMRALANKFPENIRLYVACLDGIVVAGSVIYVTAPTIHAQYISGREIGKKTGAVDALINHIIQQWSSTPGIRYFDFGTSCEDGGRYLNESLIYQKEGFGGRGICYDTWEIDLRI